MKIPTVQEMRNTDAETIRSGLYSGFALMTSAGNAAAEEIIRRTRTSNRIFHILTGSGNNGGDGFIIAANLIRTFGKKRVVLHCAVPPEKLTGDAAEAFRALPSDRIEQNDLNAEDLDPEQDLVIDCLLGTGFKGEVREPLKSWIALVNASKCPVISIDVPSGLDGDSGSGDPILADLTLTLAAPKPGLLTGNGPAACGLLKVLSIGIPDSILEQVSPGGITGIDTPYFRSLLRRLDPMTYKQKRGHVLIIGGSSAYPSAPFLAGEAALRAGAGLVTVVIPASAEIVCNVPKALIVRRAPDDETGHFTAASLPLIRSLLPAMNAVATGPGMTTETGDFLAGLLPLLTVPALFDADALNLLAKQPELLDLLPSGTILTPHAGELKRLLDTTGQKSAEVFAAQTKTILIQKGPYSRIFQGITGEKAINLSGSSILATAGSGDVLTGIVSAFLAQQYDPFTAARLGVHLHGLAGEPEDGAIFRSGNTGLIADDLLTRLPAVLQKISKI